MKVVVAGSSNTDMIIQVPRIPRPGETLLGGRFTTAPGGKGANQAVAAARAGAEVAFIARVGRDMFGDRAIQNFQADGIDVHHVSRSEQTPSGVAGIFVAADGENSIAVAGGANNELSPEDIRNAAESIIRADILVMQLEIPLETVEAAAQLAADNGVPVVLNPAPAHPLPDDLLQNITILTPNESETESLTGIVVVDEASALEAARELRTRGVATVIITLGEKGVFVSAPDLEGPVPGFPVDPVDTTAAGDVFNGALAVALASQTPLRQAIRFASAAAALSVTKLGAQPSAPRREDIERFLKERE